MKPKMFFNVLLLATLFVINTSFVRGQSVYKLPDSYRFDYEVTQMMVSKKNMGDTCVMHFFFTKNGDYTAAAITGKKSMKEKMFIVLTRDGNGILFDEHKKNITIISMRKLVSDLAGLAKWIKMDSVMAHLREKPNDKQVQSVKTGNTRQVDGYTTEEYSVSDGKGHKVSVWCAKVDFNTPGDYILGANGGTMLKMMSDRLSSHPLFQALTQPRTLVTAVEAGNSPDGKGMEMHTVGITKTSMTMATGGYQVNDYSNLSLPEIFQEEMKRKNN